MNSSINIPYHLSLNCPEVNSSTDTTPYSVPPIPVPTNMPFDEILDIRTSSDDLNVETPILHRYIGLNIYENISYEKNVIENNLEENKYCNEKIENLGDGNMEYIKNDLVREMCENAWKAITLTNNWEFVFQDIDSFMMSRDNRVDEISLKMEELGYKGHSGTSFGCTMRNMQFLAKYGEDKFKELFL